MAMPLRTTTNSCTTSMSSALRRPRSAGSCARSVEMALSTSTSSPGSASSRARNWPSSSSVAPPACSSKSSSQLLPDRRTAARTACFACAVCFCSACSSAVFTTSVAMRHFRSVEAMRVDSFISCIQASKIILSRPLCASCAACAFPARTLAFSTACMASSASPLTLSRDVVFESFWNLKILPAFTPSMILAAFSSATSTAVTAPFINFSSMTLVCICCAWA
mmetsp:Transcript_20094/g.60565  ORF Transcript_20094/g.60565 Transcript_20094/m.60565 type:complete len:222 (+) Transcript_20094:1056-1721(+)